MSKIPVIAVVGPTASGKTGLAVALAKHFDGEIVSFDSMQLYKGMDVATAKPTIEEMQGIPHHLINCVDNTEAFSVARYKDAANAAIDDIISRNKRVILVGGTGLYLDALISNITFLDDPEGEKKRLEIRRELEDELKENGPEATYEKLTEIDPKTAGLLQPGNTRKVIRALEVFYSTGKTISYQVEHSKDEESRFAPFYIGLTAKNRQNLYDRINERVDAMLENGLLSEAEEYVKNGLGSTARQAIGIKELVPYFEGNESLEVCVERIKQETRRYAKRQMTWFKRNKEIHWLYLDEMTTEEIRDAAIKIIEEEESQ